MSNPHPDVKVPNDPNQPLLHVAGVQFTVPMSNWSPNGETPQFKPEREVAPGVTIPAHYHVKIVTGSYYRDQHDRRKAVVVNMHIFTTLQSNETGVFDIVIYEKELGDGRTFRYINAIQCEDGTDMTTSFKMQENQHPSARQCFLGKTMHAVFLPTYQHTCARCERKFHSSLSPEVLIGDAVCGRCRGNDARAVNAALPNIAPPPRPGHFTHTCSQCQNDFQNTCPADKLKGDPCCPKCFHARQQAHQKDIDARVSIIIGEVMPPLETFRRRARR